MSQAVDTANCFLFEEQIHVRCHDEHVCEHAALRLKHDARVKPCFFKYMHVRSPFVHLSELFQKEKYK